MEKWKLLSKRTPSDAIGGSIIYLLVPTLSSQFKLIRIAKQREEYPVIQANYTTLAEQLQGISDPRNRRGQWHEWQYLLLVIASALMAGQRSGRAMAEWAAAHGEELVTCLHPSSTTDSQCRHALSGVEQSADCRVGKLHQCLHHDKLTRKMPCWGASRRKRARWLRGQSLDGKTLCGASQHGEVVHLVSLVRHESGYRPRPGARSQQD